MEEKIKKTICYICGNKIDKQKSSKDFTRDHIPPKQFFPKELRGKTSPNLSVLPTHRKCNEDFKLDEEYFYHILFPLVKQNNCFIGSLIHRDLSRRAKKPQTQTLIKSALKNISNKTNGGLYLPPGKIALNIDQYRIERVVLKIARGLLFSLENRFFPVSNAIDIRFCKKEDDVPELYQLSWQWEEEPIGANHEVFSYRYSTFDNLHLLSMFFWKSFMFCVTFEYQAKKII